MSLWRGSSLSTLGLHAAFPEPALSMYMHLAHSPVTLWALLVVLISCQQVFKAPDISFCECLNTCWLLRSTINVTAKRTSDQQEFQGSECNPQDLRIFCPRRQMKFMGPKNSEENRRVMGSWPALTTWWDFCSQMLNASQDKVCQNSLSPAFSFCWGILNTIQTTFGPLPSQYLATVCYILGF